MLFHLIISGPAVKSDRLVQHHHGALLRLLLPLNSELDVRKDGNCILAPCSPPRLVLSFFVKEEEEEKEKKGIEWPSLSDFKAKRH